MSDKKDKVSAANLFFSASLDSASEHLSKSQDALDRGSVENMDTHLKKVRKSLNLMSNLVKDRDFKFPRLTDEENTILRNLEASEMFELNEANRSLLERLRKKAWGGD